MASVTELLLALGSADPAVRVPAEAAVSAAKESDVSNFILTMLNELRDDSKPDYARQMAGVLLKNAVAPSLREVAARRALETRWKALPAEVRRRVHTEVLTTLGSASRDVRTVAANIIGSLSRIELPAGEWPELMGILVNAAASATPQHQEAALTTLGYIFEEGRDHDDVEAALQPSATAMLQVIVQCMGGGSNNNKGNNSGGGGNSDEENVKYSATTALCQAMEYVHANMQQANQRDVIVDALCTTAQTSASARTRARAMEALVKVAELYYHTLPAYIMRLHAITSAAIFRDEEAVGLQALQFWISICETERDLLDEADDDDNNDGAAATASAAAPVEGSSGSDAARSGCLHYTRQGLEFLVQTCLQLLVRQDEDQTEDDWNLSIAGGKLLQSVSDVVGVAVHTPVMNFVYANINSSEWRAREAAVMAFGCILGSTQRGVQEALQDTVAQAVPGLLQYVHDSHALVADTSAWVLAVVCEHYVDVFLSDEKQLQRLMNVIGPMIANDAEPSMATRACHVVHNLALAYEDDDDDDDDEANNAADDDDDDGDAAAGGSVNNNTSSSGSKKGVKSKTTTTNNNNNSSSSSVGGSSSISSKPRHASPPLASNELSPFYQDLVTVLLRAIDHGTTFELKGSAQETLNALIDAAAADSRDAYLTMLASELLSRMHAQLAVADAAGTLSEEVETMLGLLCGSISALARKLRRRFVPFLDTAMQLLLRLVRRSDGNSAAAAAASASSANGEQAYAQPEALLAMGSIAYSVGDAMAPYLAQIVPYVTRCLRAVDEPDAVHGVVATIGDLSLACTTALQPHVGALMTTLYELLLDPTVDRELKCSFLSCFGDIVPNVLRGDGFVPYMHTLMPVVTQLFDASLTIDVRGDAEGEEYVMTLWSSTATLYSSVMQSFSKATVAQLAPYLADMLRFAVYVARNAASYDETRMNAYMVIGDMASVLRGADDALRQQAKEALCAPSIVALVEQARNDDATATTSAQRAQLRWVYKQLRKLSTS